MLPSSLWRPLSGQVAGLPSRACSIHCSSLFRAYVAPLLGTGPPPDPPSPSVGSVNERLARRKRQAELLQAATSVERKAKDGESGSVPSRFWRHVRVQPADGNLQILLDSRPLRHPQTKKIINIPPSKPNLAAALAHEWDILTSAQQATKQHLVPLTSLVCRALDIEQDDALSAPNLGTMRASIASSALQYLDTDTLLCWTPPPGEYDYRNEAGEALRDVQEKVAQETLSFLERHAWPGITIVPVIDGHGFVPRPQAEGVRETVQRWIHSLDAWDLAGLERAVMAGKSLIAAARLVVEWSGRHVGHSMPMTGHKFSVEDATRAVSIEVDWQASQWGEVEDTHDVNKEDLLRQLGSVVLMVSGAGYS